MNTAEHWREGERLLQLAEAILERATENTLEEAREEAKYLVARAHVHAIYGTFQGPSGNL